MQRRFSLRWILMFTILLCSVYVITNCFNTSIAYASEITSPVIDEKKQDVKLNVKSTTIVKGKTYALKVYNLSASQKITFKSNDTDIATVNENGVIEAIKVGNATITATVKEGQKTVATLTCDVTVGPTALSVKFTKSRVILGIDKSDLLNVILKPNNTAETPRFSCSNPAVATVSIRGRVTGVSLGMTYVFAEIGNLIDASYRYSACTVICVSPEDVEPLEALFQSHSELNLVADDELRTILGEFFNQYAYDAFTKKLRSVEEPSANDNIVNNISENSTTPESTPTETVQYTYNTEVSITDNLEAFLDFKLDLNKLKTSLEDK